MYVVKQDFKTDVTQYFSIAAARRHLQDTNLNQWMSREMVQRKRVPAKKSLVADFCCTTSTGLHGSVNRGITTTTISALNSKIFKSSIIQLQGMCQQLWFS